MDSIITMVCAIGIFCAILTMLLNLNLVFKIVLKRSKRCEEMTLFYYRFTLDIFFGFCLLVYILFVLLTVHFHDFMHQLRPLIVYLALPWSNFSACRSIIALSIATERVFAAYLPLAYRSFRTRFSNIFVLISATIYGIFEDVMLFEICEYDMEIPDTCAVFGCAMNHCFYNYWTIHKTIVFSTIVVMSILLAIKLFVWNYFKYSNNNKRLSRANKLALLDTITVLMFDFLPSFGGQIWPTSNMFRFDNVGPYNTVGKVIGCSIEAVVVTKLLLGKSHKETTSDKPTSERKKSIKVFQASVKRYSLKM